MSIPGGLVEGYDFQTIALDLLVSDEFDSPWRKMPESPHHSDVVDSAERDPHVGLFVVDGHAKIPLVDSYVVAFLALDSLVVD